MPSISKRQSATPLFDYCFGKNQDTVDNTVKDVDRNQSTLDTAKLPSYDKVQALHDEGLECAQYLFERGMQVCDQTGKYEPIKIETAISFLAKAAMLGLEKADRMLVLWYECSNPTLNIRKFPKTATRWLTIAAARYEECVCVERYLRVDQPQIDSKEPTKTAHYDDDYLNDWSNKILKKMGL